MELAAELLEILRCPESRGTLIYFPMGESGDNDATAFLFCPDSRLRYRIDDGIPVMLVDEAERLDSDGAAALVARAGELGLS